MRAMKAATGMQGHNLPAIAAAARRRSPLPLLPLLFKRRH